MRKDREPFVLYFSIRPLALTVRLASRRVDKKSLKIELLRHRNFEATMVGPAESPPTSNSSHTPLFPPSPPIAPHGDGPVDFYLMGLLPRRATIPPPPL